MTLYKDVAVEYKSGEAEEDGGYIIAYASTFDRDPDAYGDVVAKGAFVKSLAKHEAENNPVQFLFGHRTDDPMYNIGSVVDIREDDHGLLVKAEFDPSNEKAQYARKLVKEGRLKKLSFAYDVLDQAAVVLPDGRKANELREVDIFEVSLVPIPANQHAQVIGVKSADDADADTSADVEIDETASEPEEKDAAEIATATVRVVPELDEEAVEDFKAAIAALINQAITEAIPAAVSATQEDQEQKEGDPSDAEASATGGKGAPADEEFLARFNRYTKKGD